MALGTLIASIVAAVAGVAAVVVPLWLRRKRLELTYTGGWSSDEGGINFVFRLENRGSTAIHQIDLSVVGPGDKFGSRGNLGTFALRADEQRDVDCRVVRPARVDMAPGALTPILKVPMTVLAYYGRKVKRVTLPAGEVWPPTGRVGRG